MDHRRKPCFHDVVFVAFVLVFSCCGCHCQEGELLIVGGSDANIEFFPYHVGIYIKASAPGAYKQACGGTLISTTLVVSAAHCFWNEQTGEKNDSSLYRVAAGKTNRSWTYRLNPKLVQRRKVAKLTLHRRYIGSAGSFANDIAIVTLDKPVTLTSSVGLAHIDWDDAWTREQLAAESIGTVAGWGISETGYSSDTLKFVSLPYVDPDTCFDSLAPNLRKLLTHDKFCAGFLNSSTSVCRGDSGGGLVFYHEGSGKKFLRGIVSLAFKPFGNNDPCYAQHYTAFTKVSSDVVRALKAGAEQGTSSTVAKCGRRGRRATPLISGGQDADEAEFPWHVTVHRVRNETMTEFLCGGSLISTDFIISAAHCFFDESTSKVYDKNRYRISAGTTRNLPYEEVATLSTAQTFEVAAISIRPEFSGSKAKLAGNLAVVRLARPAVLTPLVAPVCVDWDNAFDRDLRDGAVGVMAGLGFNSNGEFPDTLQWIEQPYVSLQTCATFARSQAKEGFIFAPNFCTGEVNKSRGVCPGDSGGGFSVVHSANQRYYLRGVVSLALRPLSYRERCYSDGYTVMQGVDYFVRWIRDVIAGDDQDDR